MFRTSRTARRGRAALTWMGEWKLPGPERRPARSERDAERQTRRERGQPAPHEQRAAELQAKRRRHESGYNPWAPRGEVILLYLS